MAPWLYNVASKSIHTEKDFLYAQAVLTWRMIGFNLGERKECYWLELKTEKSNKL